MIDLILIVIGCISSVMGLYLSLRIHDSHIYRSLVNWFSSQLKAMYYSEVFRSFLFSIFLAIVTGSLVYILWRSESTEVDEVVALLIGFTAIATLSAFKQFMTLNAYSFYDRHDRAKPKQPDDYPKPGKSTKNLDSWMAAYTDTDSEQSWHVRSEDFLGVDNAWALAVLRLNIEKELKRAAYLCDLEVNRKAVGTVPLARKLIDINSLPKSILEHLPSVLETCNQAVHGREVSNEETRDTIEKGEKILTDIRSALKIELTEVPKP